MVLLVAVIVCCLKSAKGAEYDSQGKHRATRGASTLVQRIRLKRALRVRNIHRGLCRPFRASPSIVFLNQGRLASLCSALGPWLSYSAPSSLRGINSDF